MIDFPTQPWMGSSLTLPWSNCLPKSPAAEPGWDAPLLHKLYAKQIKAEFMDKALAQEGMEVGHTC